MMALVVAIILVESGGDLNARSRTSTAAGPMQITLRTLADINRFSGTHYRPDDRFNLELSMTMYRLYLAHYATRERLGKQPTPEDYARIWHSGFRGRETRAATDYWNKVKEKLTGVKA